MTVESSSLEAQPTREKVRCLFIVARDQPDLWHHLRQGFAGDEEIKVILDRRRGERRQHFSACERERRQRDRRRSSIDRDLRYRSFVIVHERQGLLHLFPAAKRQQ